MHGVFLEARCSGGLSHKISEVIGPEAREILFQAIANGSVVSWQHINLLGEYDFSDEKLQDSVGIKPLKSGDLRVLFLWLDEMPLQ